MFRIRQILDPVLPGNKSAIEQVQKILREQFVLLDEADIEKIPDQLADPLKYRFRTFLFVSEGAKGIVRGFALLMHAPDLYFCYLDFISAAQQKTGRGIGSVLYDRVREVARSLNVVGLFFECLPDDAGLCANPEMLKQNAARLKFYERYGARPIVNTRYEAPVNPGDDCPPYLVFDNLGANINLQRDQAREFVRAILERKYHDLCPKDYVDLVVNSFQDDPVQLRSPRYVKQAAAIQPVHVHSDEERIILVVNDKHDIHHVRERGYVESPVRIRSILNELLPANLFFKLKPKAFAERYIRAVHDPDFVNYLKKVCANVPDNKSVYPYVFPIRNAARPPKELPVRAGYYCIDTFTPLNQNAFLAAKRAVDCTLTAAESLLNGYRLAYALVRPPGHHAEQRVFGGFCYFNSNAIAAHYLSTYGKVAILDLDYHHGNGQQDIFYHRSDVLTISLHGHPRFAYPYFSGFADEYGEGEGLGYNLNFPLAEEMTGVHYRQTLDKALRRIEKFQPKFLLVALGLDPAKGDPTGTWSLMAKDFEENGRMIGALGLPVLVVQEGGYKTRSLGINARHFFTGLWHSSIAVLRGNHADRRKK
ncbi:histone deacetylase family protein [candidate division KSB1 bacterium]|nr:histone deacetylase family protein [candidate division KSB1 bacterium]RQW01968.1 MAG: histone deacetylase family protein [candidate division KSB1 bacterium]